MEVFLFLLILPLLILFFMHYKSKDSHTHHPSCLSLFHTRNLPKSYSLISLGRLGEQGRLPYMSKMLESSPSSTLVLHLPLGSGCYIFTANPENVRHILSNQFHAYKKGHTFMSPFGELFGHSMINVDGDEWRSQRKFSSHEFTKGSARGFLEMVVAPCISNCLIPTLSDIAAKKGRVFDLQDVLQRFSMDTICKMMFGYDPKCLPRSLEGSEFMKAFREAVSMVSQRSKTAMKIWKVEKFFNVGSQRRLMHAINKIRGFALGIVNYRLEKLKLGLQGNHHDDDFLSRLLNNHDMSIPEDENMIIDFIILTILAGYESVSSALTWFFWLVSTNPKVEDEILREMRRVLEECRGRGSVYDQVKDMVYTHAALCESMRLYPPVPEDMKIAAKDDVWPDGTQVKAGTGIVYLLYSMGRSQRIWGEDWTEYKPERWLERKGSTSEGWRFVPRDPYTYPVFNAGPRFCLGKELAFLQMKSLVAQLLNEFKVVPLNGADPKFVFDLTAKMEGGFPVNLEERSAYSSRNSTS